MPELPEVETIVRDLAREIQGATIRRAQVFKPDLIGSSGFEERLRGRKIEQITRRAKNIVFDLGDDRLIVNLGMTGSLLVGDAEPDYVGVRFDLDDGRRLWYRDVRRFGRLEVLTRAEWESRDARLGVEPLGRDFTPELLHELTRGSRVAVKVWLMDQKRVVGVGNIYASEALFRAKMNPRRKAGTLTRPAAKRLRDGIRQVLREAIRYRGTSISDYRDAAGREGEFSGLLKVYGRAGEPCVVCGTPIRRIVQAGRSTFYCPHCQAR